MNQGKMKVLLVCEVYPPASLARGGLDKTIRFQKEHLSPWVDFRVVAPVRRLPPLRRYRAWARSYPRLPQWEMEESTIVFRPRYFHFPIVWRRREVPLLVKKLKRFFEVVEWVPDILHVHGGGPLALAATLVARERYLPCVLTAHGSEVNMLHTEGRSGGTMLRFTWEAIQNAARVIVVSGEMRDHLEELEIDPGKIAVIPNGVALEEFEIDDRGNARAALGLPLGKKIILAAGAHFPVKGFSFALDAFARLPQDCEMVLGGQGPLTGQLRHRANKLGIGERVRFVGQIKRMEMWMNAADVLVSSSLQEGWPLTLVESLACGTPVVATAVGGARELLEEVDRRLLAKPADPESLADAIRYALGTPFDREKLRKTAAKYSWSNLASRTASLYAGLLVERK